MFYTLTNNDVLRCRSLPDESSYQPILSVYVAMQKLMAMENKTAREQPEPFFTKAGTITCA
jgi:hypothetical protein